MTKAYKVSAVAPFPVGRDSKIVYYAFEEDPGFEVGQEVLLKPDPQEITLDAVQTQRELAFYDMGVEELISALQRLLSSTSRAGVSQRKWQLLKEQIWQLQDLSETCSELAKADASTDRWWYRIDGATGKVVLFQLAGADRELVVEGDFSSDEDRSSFAKSIANLINLAQDARCSIRAREMAQSLFQSVSARARLRAASGHQDDSSTTQE